MDSCMAVYAITPLKKANNVQGWESANSDRKDLEGKKWGTEFIRWLKMGSFVLFTQRTWVWFSVPMSVAYVHV